MTSRAQVLRKHMTEAERALWQHLRNKQTGVRFRRQAPIGRYVADFACYNPRVVIEVDGGQHSTQLTHDANRTAWLQSQGFVVLRFWNNEVLRDPEGVVAKIAQVLPPT